MTPSRTSDFSFYLVDASGFIFRAFHALPPMLNKEGIPCGAVYGFLSMLMTLLQEHRPQKLGVVFDVARKTFRQDLYPAYKMNREDPPEDLCVQFELVRQGCRAFGFPTLEQAGFEADDVLASYVHQASLNQEKVTLVSSDKDLMQLVSPLTRLWDPMKRKEIREPEVFEKFGVTPEKVIEVQALMGDSSDNIPGVPGIGIKTAQALIQQFGSLENLYAHLEEVPQIKRREILATYQKEAFLSRKLVHLAHDVPLIHPAKDLIYQGISSESAHSFLVRQGFQSLVNRLNNFQNSSQEQTTSRPTVTPSPSVTSSYTLIQDIPLLEKWIHLASEKGRIAVDLETTSLNALEAKIVGIALALDAGQAAYIPLSHQTEDPQLSLETVLALLKPLFEDSSVLKIGHHLKYDMLVLKKYSLSLEPIADTLLMSYVLNGTTHAHNLDFLSQHYLQHTTITYEEVTGTGKNKCTFSDVPLERALAYAAEDADMTLRLWQLFRPLLRTHHLERMYDTVEKPLIPVLVDIEATGIKIDAQALQKLSQDFDTKLELLSHSIYEEAGQNFNIASPKQLGTVLFDNLGFPGGKKTKTGAYATSSDVLEKLALTHKIAELILAWRGLSKLKNTYTDALPLQINPSTQRVHTSFIMTGTSTGRLASTDPNLQNIPIRTSEGRAIRQAFIPEEGHILTSFDYSQIELRLLAHMGQVTPLIDAFKSGADIHTQTASQVFSVAPDQVDSKLRRQAKMINFGIIYGISAFGLGQRLGIPSSEAARYIKAYFEHYAGIDIYMKRMKEIAGKQGYVETLWGRQCFIPGIQDRNSMVRQAAERQAINAPLQGTAADLIKKAMIQIHIFLKNQNTSVRMILQIHDELLFEGTPQDIEMLSPQINDLMTHVISLDVPLLVDQGKGKNWDEAH